jgi:iron complex outermembrane recepter protein
MIRSGARLVLSSIVVALAGSAPAVCAQEVAVRIEIPAQRLESALLEFSRQTRRQLLFAPDIVRGRTARAVAGTYPPLIALRRLLAGSDLTVRATALGVFIISADRAGKVTRSVPAAAKAPVSAEIDPVTIVVTARRREEIQQNVPQTVNAVTARDLQRFNVQRLQDLQYLVAGLDLSSGARGFSNSASMRGVTFATESAATPTVEFYLNDVPVSSGFLFQSLFDTQQIEVLRGPQGTLRGRAAPSGAITLTTREPDLGEVGGYAELTGTSTGAVNAHAAVNLPIVDGDAAIRVAGLVDHNDYDGVRSVNHPANPWQKTRAVRATLRVEPFANLSATMMYQHLVKDMGTFPHVAGMGSSGGAISVVNHTDPVRLAAGYNGPVLRSQDRRSVVEAPFLSTDRYEIVTAQANWRLMSQRLMYVGSYASGRNLSVRPGDGGNLLPAYEYDVTTSSSNRYWTHEIRLESEERLGGMLDYAVGVFRSHTSGETSSNRGPSFNIGAFGSPMGAPSPFGPVIARYSSASGLDRSRLTRETSLFGNLTLHFSERTELSVGGRYIAAGKNSATRFTRLAGGFELVPAASGGCDIGQAPSAFYPAFCDAPIAAGQLGATIVEEGNRRPFIYNVQLNRQFGERLMVYVTHGTSWRDGPVSVGITNGGRGSDGGTGDPVLRALANARPETSSAFEAGLKATWPDNRGRISLALYRQTFDGFIYRGTPTYYLSDNGVSPPSVVRFNFTTNADAIVEGLDLDFAFQLQPRWNVAGGFSYARGRIDNALVPCNDGDFDGDMDAIVPSVADFLAAGSRIAQCISGRSISQTPRWNLALQSEYSFPVIRGNEAYLRGQLSYYPANRQEDEGDPIGGYGIVSLYAGIRDLGGRWSLGVFVKNLAGSNRLAAREAIEVVSDGGVGRFFGTSGYYNVRNTPRATVGINMALMR